MAGPALRLTGTLLLGVLLPLSATTADPFSGVRWIWYSAVPMPDSISFPAGTETQLHAIYPDGTTGQTEFGLEIGPDYGGRLRAFNADSAAPLPDGRVAWVDGQGTRLARPGQRADMRRGSGAAKLAAEHLYLGLSVVRRGERIEVLRRLYVKPGEPRAASAVISRDSITSRNLTAPRPKTRFIRVASSVR